MRLLKIHEVAELLRCSVPTVRRWLSEARRGERLFPLPLNKPKGKNLWDADDIECWTENPKPEPKGETKRQREVRQRCEIAGLMRHGIHINSSNFQ